jgi:uncharacterized cupin superfamily protein
MHENRLKIFAPMEPEAGGPDHSRIVSGDPKFRTWNHYTSPDERTFAGVWESTPGTWHVTYDEWEYCHIVSGVSILAPLGGAPRKVKAGDSFVIEPGFRGTWQVVETTTKHYVIRLS